MIGPYKFALQKNNKTCVLVRLSARFQQGVVSPVVVVVVVVVVTASCELAKRKVDRRYSFECYIASLWVSFCASPFVH